MKKYKEVILELSKNCNLNCIMCGYGARFNKPDKYMDYSLFNYILGQLNGDFNVIRLNGRGESTIHPHFVKFLSRARKVYPEARLRLFTNMNYNDMDITRALWESRCETMMSLDSLRKDKLEYIRAGTNFERMIRNIEELCARANTTAIVFTLQPDNFFEIEELARFAIEHNCHFFCNAVRNEWMEQDFYKLVTANVDYLRDAYARVNELYDGSELTLHLPDQLGGVKLVGTVAQATCSDMPCCPNVGKDFCIYYDGTVTPCGMFNPYDLGNIRDHTLDEIMSGSKFAEFAKNQTTDPYCRNCQYICG